MPFRLSFKKKIEKSFAVLLTRSKHISRIEISRIRTYTYFAEANADSTQYPQFLSFRIISL